MLKHSTCVSVECDVCKEAFKGYADEGILHFDGIDEAREEADNCDNWFVGADGVALCGDDDEGHLSQARTWLDAGKLSTDELAMLCRAYPQLMPDEDEDEIDGQLALAGIASEVPGE